MLALILTILSLVLPAAAQDDSVYIYVTFVLDSPAPSVLARMNDMEANGLVTWGLNELRIAIKVEVGCDGKIYICDHNEDPFSSLPSRIIRIDDISGAGFTYWWDEAPSFWPHAALSACDGKIYIADCRHITRIDDMSGAGRTTYCPCPEETLEHGGFIDLVIDSSERIYTLFRNRIFRFDDMTGTNLVAYGDSGSGVGEFGSAWSIDLDPEGRIYIADYSNHRIVRIDDMTGAGWVALGDSGTGVGEFVHPVDISVGPDGKIYVVDTSGRRIIRFDDMTGAGWTELDCRTLGLGWPFSICVVPRASPDTEKVAETSAEKLHLSVSPNPFREALRIDAPADADVVVYDAIGRVVHRQRGGGVWRPKGAGAYVVTAELGGKRESRIVVKTE